MNDDEFLQVTNDPFMKQVGHGSMIASALSTEASKENEEQITELLSAQLSHSDGIRGFFVSYLTSSDESEDIDEVDVDVPSALVAAMGTANKEELIPLGCT